MFKSMALAVVSVCASVWLCVGLRHAIYSGERPLVFYAGFAASLIFGMLLSHAKGRYGFVEDCLLSLKYWGKVLLVVGLQVMTAMVGLAIVDNDMVSDPLFVWSLMAAAVPTVVLCILVLMSKPAVSTGSTSTT